MFFFIYLKSSINQVKTYKSIEPRNLNQFLLNFLQNLLNKFQSEKKFSVLAGDFNLNLTQYSKTTGINQFLEIIFFHNFMPQITLPTRAATLIDNTLINSYENKCTSGNKHFCLQSSLTVSYY